jgi:hypothetical protein
VVVFRNTAILIKASPFENVDYYSGDLRVALVREMVFEWKG